jgi:superfamily II DNA/RNA helicase
VLFKELKLDSRLLQAIAASGFKTPTEIQRAAIPAVLSGMDLMASARTGTGKTAAFVLPALQRLITTPGPRGRGARVLVLTPTRELAIQVNENIRQFSRHCKVTTGNIIGGTGYPLQIQLLKRPLDLLVATPGRLMDHMEQGRVDFSRLEILVLDEADRMLDMGFIDAVRKIARETPSTRQTLLFSATLEGKVMDVARVLLQNPVRIQLAANNEHHAAISQRMYQADDTAHKHRLLSHYLSSDSLSQTIVFTATKRGADKLARHLSKQGYNSAALHGDMGQGARKRTVEHMRQGKLRALVATDVAARGLDIKGISHVINFDLPMVAEDYIHRIGRTGRAGALGTAISLVGPDDWTRLSGIERLTGRRLERSVIQGLEPSAREPRTSNRGNGRNTRKQTDKSYHGKRGARSQVKFSPAKVRGKKGAHRKNSPQVVLI